MSSPVGIVPAFSFGSFYSSIAVFLLGAISLAVDSGYSFGAALLLLGGLFSLYKPRGFALSRDDYLIIGVLLAFGLVQIFDIAIHQAGSRPLDKPVRFILAVFALALLRKYPPRLAWLWAGVAVGGILVGGWALYQKFSLDLLRAGGYTLVIQFGNIAMLTGLFCLAGLAWAYVQKHRWLWVLVLLLGALGGLLASFLSGSRGGWLGLPLVLLVLYIAYGNCFALRTRLVAVAAVVVSAIAIYNIPQLVVQQRVQQAVQEVSRYLEGNSRSSAGARFEMWKGASQLFIEKPVLGWGDSNYKAAMNDLADHGRAHEIVRKFGHPHNELLNQAAKQGILGALALLALYLVPLGLFGRSLRAPDLTERSLATAGVLLSVSYISFGLTQAFFAHNSGVMIYAFWLVVLWGCYRNQREVAGSAV